MFKNRASISLLFFLCGINFASWATRIPDFKEKLHLIGKLQTNKVAEAINHFSFIHSLDSEKLALKISIEEKNFNKKAVTLSAILIPPAPLRGEGRIPAPLGLGARAGGGTA